MSIVLHNMDCMDAMVQMKDNEFDLAIVDPPYGIGMDGGNVGYKGFNDFPKKDWDSSKPNENYFKELFRISRNQIIWGGNYFGLQGTRCFIVWDKGEGFKRRTYAEAELAWTSFDLNVRIYKYDPLANRDYHGKIHPTQKPVALYKWLLKNYTKEGDKILDTHLGSGSIGIACWDYELDLVGYEIDEDYFKAAKKRIESHMDQPRGIFNEREIN